MQVAGGPPSQGWAQLFSTLIATVLNLGCAELQLLIDHAVGLLAAREVASRRAGTDAGSSRRSDEPVEGVPPAWCKCGGRCTVCGHGWCNKSSPHDYSGRCTCAQCHSVRRHARRSANRG